MTVSSLRYHAAALALKFFSLNPWTRKAYRILGNRICREKHASLAPIEVERGLWLRDLIRARPRPAGKFLELGTGWTHFYSLFLRHFFADEIVLFDVQDNRNLRAAKKRLGKLAEILIQDLPPGAAGDRIRMEKIRATIAAAPDFQALYDQLDMTYLVSPTGRLGDFKDDEFDVIFSMDVLEHIPTDQLNENSPDMYRMLRPGGLLIHQIGLDDHLAHYAPRMPKKNYLRYSEKIWRRAFDNTVQFMNRLQVSDYLEIFRRCGFRILECGVETEPQSVPEKIAARYAPYPANELAAVRARLVCLK